MNMENLPFWILTVAYSGHILEEYVLDWKSWAEHISGMKLEWSEFFVANFAVIILGISCSVIGFEYPLFSYMFVGLTAVNALFAHIGTAVVKRKFSPGLLTSIFLFIPICIWAYVMAAQKGIFTTFFLLITLLGGFIIMLFPIVLQKLKHKLVCNSYQKRKRKVIDLDEKTFRILSIKAASTGTNLKVLIEKALSNMAENMEDVDMYNFLVQTDPNGKKNLDKGEQSAFENWLGI